MHLETNAEQRTETGAPCAVPSCDFAVFHRKGLCFYHYDKRRRNCPTTDVAEWSQRQSPFLHAQHFSLAPLQPPVRLEVLYALQQRDLDGLCLNPALVRRLVKKLEPESSARHMSTVSDGKLPKSSR